MTDLHDEIVRRTMKYFVFSALRMAFFCSMVFLALHGRSYGKTTQVVEGQPNVLLIMVDDLNASLPCYGVEGAITPHLDELASAGRVFNNAYCQASLCNPSRSSMMTGRRPHQLDIWTNHPHFRGMYPRIKTLPERFKDMGYYTVGIGKIYHNWGQAIDGDPQSWTEPQSMHWATHFRDWYVPGRPYELHEDLSKGPSVQCENVPDEAYLDGRIANAAVTRLRELQETTFFLAVGFWKPHLPYNAPKKYWDLYDAEDLPPVQYRKPVRGVPDIAYVNSDEARSYTDVEKEGPIPGSMKTTLRHGYFAAISYMDAQVGKVLDEVERLGLDRNTIIVFASDHGYHAGEHGQFGKWTNFEIGTQVPLIIKTPGLPQQGVPATGIAELVDVFPTLLELCGLGMSGDAEILSGVSLIPMLSDPAARVKDAAVSQISRPLGAGLDFPILGSTIRTESMRYNVWIRRSDGTVVAEELYDVSENPYRIENQADDPQMQTQKNSLYNQLMEIVQ